MKKIQLYNKLFVSISAIALFSCWSIDKKVKTFDSKTFTNFLTNTTGPSTIARKAYLIIPVDQGCSSCISKSLLFAKENIGSSSLGIVLSASSSKTINRVLADNFPDNINSDFICDSKSFAKVLGVTAFPIILYAESKAVESINLNAENIEAELGSLLERIQ
jgi:hypothetical protein